MINRIHSFYNPKLKGDIIIFLNQILSINDRSGFNKKSDMFNNEAINTIEEQNTD